MNPEYLEAWISPSSATEVSMEIINGTSRRLDLQWMSFSGEATSFAKVDGNSRSKMNTYVDHIWRLVDETTKELYCYFS